MATAWPPQRRLIGTKVQRLDGPDKATAKTKYSFDITRPGMLHALMPRSPHAHARVKGVDASAAEKMPGVRAVFLIVKPGEEVYYAGAEIMALAADTEEHAADALRRVQVDYEV